MAKDDKKEISNNKNTFFVQPYYRPEKNTGGVCVSKGNVEICGGGNTNGSVDFNIKISESEGFPCTIL